MGACLEHHTAGAEDETGDDKKRPGGKSGPGPLKKPSDLLASNSCLLEQDRLERKPEPELPDALLGLPASPANAFGFMNTVFAVWLASVPVKTAPTRTAPTLNAGLIALNRLNTSRDQPRRSAVLEA